MDKSNTEINVIALVCSPEGIIEKIWHDDFGIKAADPLNKPFSQLMDKGSRDKALTFIYDTKTQQSAFGVELNIHFQNAVRLLTFMGILSNDKILVFGVENTEEAGNFMNYLQQINNEHINTIRQLLKEKSATGEQATVPSRDEDSLYNEITRLNNEMANVQRQLTKKNTELDRANQLKNRFLGIAAHDLRNPLNIIQSYADFLIDEAGELLEEEHMEFLNRIMYSSEYMLKLIENLLDYSRIESGEMKIDTERFDIIGFARRIIDLNNVLAQRKNITISLDTQQQELEISADKQKLEQVFNNLLSNAVKFSYPDSEINMNIEQQDKQIYIAITDQGRGIKSADLEKVFVPFTTISRKGTAGEKGTGLGLSIVKKIIENHRGKIWVESKEGEGTVFKMSFPYEGL